MTKTDSARIETWRKLREDENIVALLRSDPAFALLVGELVAAFGVLEPAALTETVRPVPPDQFA